MLAAERLQEVFTNGTEKHAGAQDWTEVDEAVRWIQLIVALLRSDLLLPVLVKLVFSVLGSGSTIVCVTSQRLSRTPELQPLVLLGVSDLLLALCWLIGAALIRRRCSSSSLNPLCYHLHTVEQVLYTASFFYTLNYVWHVYAGIRDQYYSCSGGPSAQSSNRVKTANRITALLSGLFPVLLMTPVLIQGNISQCPANVSEPYRCLLTHTGAPYPTPELHEPTRACRLLHTYRVAVFLATFILTLLSVTVLVVKACHTYRRVVTSSGYLGHQQQAAVRLTARRMLLFPLVFVFCWGPAVALGFLWMVRPSACRSEAGATLYISQAFTSTSQGFLNGLLYGWTRAHVRRAARVVLSRDADTQTPLLRSQKRRSYQTVRTIG